MISASTIAAVKAATDLVSLVGEYVSLRKQGTRHVGICPFHGPERTASFGVNADNFWKCFGCGEGGDCFTFLMKVKGILFGDALRELAERAGISLNERPVSKVAIAWAREEADCARWWWSKRHSRMVRQAQRDYDSMPDADLEWCNIIAMPLAHDAAMTPQERFAFFKAHVTQAEREEWRREVQSEREFERAWMALAQHAQ